ncbi:hypothetical protein NAC44_08625 [Allorhizobium sp. BGMRC 0089]|uniref:citrate/2-methylcitrate synthase n=1 Tax=Allorhizobium sonneratiae TaxID=2934936 RepID=UPI00203338A2|nr:citrate/2-methylcitrate synthase [Allorhizobium sonneratiae]MCM2292393.1 hypothetical protein [Allorhizobium sonneratiae]
MRYHGTSIDGVSIDPDGLEVRGVDLAEIIASYRYTEAILHILTGKGRDGARGDILDRGFCRLLARLSGDEPALALSARAALLGSSAIEAVAAGLLVPSPFSLDEATLADLDIAPDIGEALALIAVLPVMLRFATGPDTAKVALAGMQAAQGQGQDQGQGLDFVSRLHRLFVEDHHPLAAQRSASLGLERALVGWHGGFGYLPPSVMIPRISIGTGVPLRHAVSAGFGAGGPMHIGATEYAVRVLLTMLSAMEQGLSANEAAKRAVAHIRENGLRLPGFGHPLFNKDPRPDVLIAAARPLLEGSAVLSAFEALQVEARSSLDLLPNIDSAMATVFIACGITDPKTAAALSLCSRAVAMLAHCLERRTKPAFGVTSRIAREHLHSLPKDWI